MRRLLILFMLAVLTGGVLTAQLNRTDRINAEKIAFFTKRLALSAEDAQKFWPVYNDFSSRKAKLTQEKNGIIRFSAQNFDNMSDKEKVESADRIIAIIGEEAELSTEYHSKFRDVLGPARLLLLYQTEEQFKNYLLRKLQERRNQQTPANQARRRLPL